MTGTIKLDVTLLEECDLRWFTDVWNLSHHLDIIIQESMTMFINEEFRKPFVQFISFLRRETNQSAEIRSSFPVISATRWLSMGRHVVE